MQRDSKPDGRGQGDDAQASHAAIEIRSYRRVFALERRLYQIDRLRLNPTGVPLRGIAYFLALLGAVLLLSGLPLVGDVVRIVPWYLREAIAPALAAAVCTVIRVEGRPFHLAALALLRYHLSSRHCAGVRRCSAPGSRWHPGELLVLRRRVRLRVKR
jgi:hypothetical protein